MARFFGTVDDVEALIPIPWYRDLHFDELRQCTTRLGGEGFVVDRA